MPSLLADAIVGVEEGKQDAEDDLDKEIDRVLTEIRQASSNDDEITEKENESSAGSTIESSLRDGLANTPTMATIDADNSMSGAAALIADTAETSKEVTIMEALQYLEKQNRLIQVMFTPSSPSSLGENMSFLVSASLVAQRERELAAMASANCMVETTWSGSLLGRKCLALVGDIALTATGDDDDYFSCASNDDAEDATSNDENTFTFVLGNPSRSGTHLAWTPAVVDAIRSYYTLGSISISDDCDGRDILFALEYFGIIYSAEQLVHQSFGVQLRVKLWSEYFAARGQLAEWVMETIISGRSKLSYSFVTCSDTDDGPVFVGTTKVEVFDGGIGEEGGNKSAPIVHDLFVDESSLDEDSDMVDSIDSLIRRDFCAYLSDRLPGCSISFDLRYVGIGGPLREGEADDSNPSTFSIRAVLHLDFSGRSMKKATNKGTVVSPLEGEGKKSGETTACQTAIRTLDNDGDSELEGKIHPHLATAPTIVDLDEEETVDVPVRQVNNDDDSENKSAISALSSPDDGERLLTTVVEEDEGAAYSIPSPPPTPEVNAQDAPVALTDATEEKSDFVPMAGTQEQPMPPTKADASCVTIEDLNSQWLLDFINPFTSFVEDTLQACNDSNTVAKVESVLWQSLLSTPNISSGAKSPGFDVQLPPTPVRVTTVDSMDLPVRRKAAAGPFTEERTMPKEAGIEVRPLKTRAADVEPQLPAFNGRNAPTPVARNGTFTGPLVMSTAGDPKHTASSGTKKTTRIKKVVSKRRSKK